MKVKCKKCSKKFNYEINHGICANCGIYNKSDSILDRNDIGKEFKNETNKFLKENNLIIKLLILSLFLPIIAFFFSMIQIIN